MRRCVFTAFIICALTSISPAAAQERAGKVVRAQADAFQAITSIGSVLDNDDAVFRGARVYTKAYGTVQILLDDRTDVMISPNSSIVIDDYVYAGGTGDRFAMTLTRGALRVISGRMAKGGYSVSTSVASIGVRGTRYWLDVDEPNLLKIWVDEGAVVARPVNSDQEFEFTAPVYAECTPTTCAPSPAPPPPEKFPTDPRQR